MRAVRIAAYGFAVSAAMITVPVTVDAGDQAIVFGVLGATLVVTPYVWVKAIEESLKTSHRSNQDRAFCEKSPNTETFLPFFG